jgi:hypothetical protein
MAVIPDFTANTINNLLIKNVAAGATLYTEGLKSFGGLEGLGFKHVPRIQPLRSELRKGANSVVPPGRTEPSATCNNGWLAPTTALVAVSSKSTSTSSSSDTTAGGSPWPLSKLSWALELSTIPYPTRPSERQKTFQSLLPCLPLPIPPSIFLKQPDKQKLAYLG